jgi:hypothetical protein
VLIAGGVVLGAAIVLIAARRHAVDRQILDQVQRIRRYPCPSGPRDRRMKRLTMAVITVSLRQAKCLAHLPAW